MIESTIMNIGLAADHGGFELKKAVKSHLEKKGFGVTDFGASLFNKDDDYPDFVIPLARAVANGELERGIAICGSGVEASVAANKISGIRAAVVHEVFSAHQGVEDDDMNVLCLGGRVIGPELALDLINIFLQTEFSGAKRHRRRLLKIKALEQTR